MNDRKKIASDGLSTDYYKVPNNIKTISELIEYKGMKPSISVIFRSCVDLHLFNRYMIDSKLDEMLRLAENPDQQQVFYITDEIVIPQHVTELRHLISYFSMSKSRGDVYKACYRLGTKEGVDEQYDLNKIIFFIQDLKEMNARKEHI